MIDRDKVIKGLESCLNANCLTCPYWHDEPDRCGLHRGIMQDALELLKAQEEPHVLSREDILAEIIPDVIWAEFKGDTMLTPGVWQITNYEMADGSVIDDLAEEVRNTVNYGVHWRVWDGRPTEKQREATSWDE